MTPTTTELMAALPHVLAAPKTDSRIESLCLRPNRNQRTFPDHLTLTQDQGVLGDRWLTEPWLRLPDGRPDPNIQVSLLPLRVLNLIWAETDAAPHPGDTIIADLDTSEANLPAGTRLQVGDAVLRVSGVFNDGCVKWKVRYGADAKNWITASDHPTLRLRGILCAVETDGIIRLGDSITKV
ncbi:MOSC domain-containing protein [Pseudorhodobacter sp. W20_MBD10_FR17]|uniref:MOSC domain-containing protein n=1 Tax=Pseudorhodobacter sp. W20_MBD10_FR17 TaxID=3240266 RepID=UPI003F989509